MGSRSRSGRRRAATRAGVGGVDLISRLSNDLLVRILELLPDARDVVRTGALSRRWCRVWTGVAALRFDFHSRPQKFPAEADERYLSFVNDILAFRAGATANDESPAVVGVEDLAISFDTSSHETGQLVPRSVEAAQGWIRYAAQQGVKPFSLKLQLPWRWPWNMNRRIGGDDGNVDYPMLTLDDDDNIGYPVLTLDDKTDSYGKMETLHLRLGHAELRLPSPAVAFASLTELSLQDIKLPADGGNLLSRFVSSARCPRLHKLRLGSFKISTKEKLKLLIEAAALFELLLEGFGVEFLELRTPSLHVLHIENCKLKVFTVSAPRLEDLMAYVRPLHINDVHGHLSSVGTLKIQLFNRGMTSYDRNAGCIRLLKSCRLTKCLEVSFWVTEETNYQTVDIIKGRIPPLPHVTSLSVHIGLRERHSSGPGVASLLAQCSNIKYLSLQLRYYFFSKKDHTELDLLCDYKCDWKSNEFSLAHLQEVEFKNLIGTNCEFRFIQSILTGATGIQKVTISFDRYYRQKVSKHAFKVMPLLDGGSWTTCIDTSSSYKQRSEDLVYEWTRE